jgi:quercetin dioxygenase-like cupin family protein
VEKSLIYPSLPALYRIAENLSVEVATLFKEHGEKENVYVFHGDRRSITSLSKDVKDNAEAELLIPADIDAPAEITIVKIRPGSKLRSHFFSHKGTELGFLLSGQLEMTIENQSYEVKPGDTIYLQKNIPGSWKNTTDQVAELLWLKFKS